MNELYSKQIWREMCKIFYSKLHRKGKMDFPVMNFLKNQYRKARGLVQIVAYILWQKGKHKLCCLMQLLLHLLIKIH